LGGILHFPLTKESLRTELSTIRVKTESLEAENKDLIEGRKKLEQKVESLRDSLNASEKNLAIEREKIRSALEAKSKREAEIERLRTEHHKERGTLETIHSREIERLMSELERVRGEFESREKKLELKIEKLESARPQKSAKGQKENKVPAEI
jgi:chromosome segregation ATPase